MFVLSQMKDTVRIPPWLFHLNFNDAVIEALNKKLANKVSHDKGITLILCMIEQREIILTMSWKVIRANLFRWNLVYFYHSQVNIFIIFITFLSGEFQCCCRHIDENVGTAMRNQGVRGLVNFVRTMNFSQTWHIASLGEGDSSLYKWRATPFHKGR